MKIDKLQIQAFKNLRDVSLDFDEKSLTTVLLGRNGTGKSNVIEALVVLFRDLDLAQAPSFSYTIEYICQERRVRLQATADPALGGPARQYAATADGVPVRFSQLINTRERRYLPRHVFGYYSGPSNRLEHHFQKHQDRFREELIDPSASNERLPLRPFFYARLIHSQFVLLSFFLNDEQPTKEFLNSYLSITGLESVLFVLRRPPWANTRRGDPRFWGAVGVVSQFLSHLYDQALAPLRLGSGPDERLYLFIKDVDALRMLFKTATLPDDDEETPTQGDFFKMLESTYISELVEEVRIRVWVRGINDPLTFTELSEGEQQLLTVLGLLRFTRDSESLFLLDEPDTHLNPAWSLQYLELLAQVVGPNPSSHVILTTHDPLTIAGLLREQVQILVRDKASERITAAPPDQNPRGMGVAALLTSEIFGLRSTLDPDTLRLLDRKRELAVNDDLTSEELRELDDLNHKLGNLDFTKSVRDPLYRPFVEAMTESEDYQSLRKPVLTPEEQERQRELARQIVERLKSGKQQ